jgi:hypothetical protein
MNNSLQQESPASLPLVSLGQRNLIALARLAPVLLWVTTGVAHAAYGQIGGGLLSYAEPIILFLGVGAVVVALVGAVFKPELVKGAVWAAVILVIVFFILHNAGSLESAVQAG